MTIKEYIKARKEEIKAEVAKMEKKPNLVIVQLNEDEASKAYVKGKLFTLAFPSYFLFIET